MIMISVQSFLYLKMDKTEISIKKKFMKTKNFVWLCKLIDSLLLQAETVLVFDWFYGN